MYSDICSDIFGHSIWHLLFVFYLAVVSGMYSDICLAYILAFDLAFTLTFSLAFYLAPTLVLLWHLYLAPIVTVSLWSCLDFWHFMTWILLAGVPTFFLACIRVRVFPAWSGARDTVRTVRWSSPIWLRVHMVDVESCVVNFRVTMKSPTAW
jgi:hypothetical protein